MKLSELKLLLTHHEVFPEGKVFFFLFFDMTEESIVKIILVYMLHYNFLCHINLCGLEGCSLDSKLTMTDLVQVGPAELVGIQRSVFIAVSHEGTRAVSLLHLDSNYCGGGPSTSPVFIFIFCCIYALLDTTMTSNSYTWRNTT